MKNENMKAEELLNIAQETQRKNSTIRPFILLTLIHAEAEGRAHVNAARIMERIKLLYDCIAIVIATEKHTEQEGKHYHVGIWATNASKNTLRRKLRKEFPEWNGRAIDITLHKGWGSICAYTLKEDKEPLIWGEYNLDQIRVIAQAHEQKKEVNLEVGSLALLKKLEQLEDWYQVYRDDILANKVLSNLPRMKEAFEDLKVLKGIETNVFNRIIDYLKEKGNPKEYDVEEIREKYLVIDWIACQLCFRRPLKTKQLFIYGEPSTQKTLLLNYLAKVIKVYFASSRRNDFAGANDYYDLWAFDEFHEQELWQEGQQMGGSTTEGSAFVNNLLKVLDGQECRLDSKYARVFKKKRNVPIIMIANKLPQIMERHGPFRARFFRIRFSTQIQNLEEERVIATLWGCLIRRAIKSPYNNNNGGETPTEVDLTYNGANALIITPGEEEGRDEGEGSAGKRNEWERAIQRIENPIQEKRDKKEIETIMKSEPILITKEGEFYKLKPKIITFQQGYEDIQGYRILIFEILKLEEESWEGKSNGISLIDFASIPIKKKEEERKREKKEKRNLKWLFQQHEKGINEQEAEKGKKAQEESIIRLNSIFLDKKERDWIRGEQMCIDENTEIENQEVWSVISVQRNKKNQEQDYAMWPLEIKIFQKENPWRGGKRAKKVFPAILRNVRRKTEEEKIIQKMYKQLKKTIEKSKENAEIKAIKCEISIARNGERQPWNLKC